MSEVICDYSCVQVDNDGVQVKPPLLRVRLDTLTSVMSDIDTSDDEEENGAGPLDVLACLVSLWHPTFLMLVSPCLVLQCTLLHGLFSFTSRLCQC